MTYGANERAETPQAIFRRQNRGEGRQWSKNATTAPETRPARQARRPLCPRCGRAQVIRHGLGHLSPAWMVCRANERGGVPPGVQADGGSRVGIPAGAARSPERARTRAGMERGAAPALDATGAPQPIGKGEEQGRSPLGLPPQPVGQVPTREALKPKRFQVKPEGREGGRRQTDEACSEHIEAAAPAFSAKPCGGRALMRPVLGLAGGAATGGPSGPLWGPR